MIEPLSNTLNRWVEALLVGLGVAMTAVVALQVFFRYGLNHSLFWSEEVARLLLVWMSFLGASVVYRRRAHPGLDVMTRRLSPNIRTRLEILVHVASLLLFGVMIVYGIRFSWFVRFQITPALSMPKWIAIAGIPLSGMILVVHDLAFLTPLLKRNRT